MPTIPNWPKFFERFAATGYNMVHLAPCNKRGISNSPYSINDQLALADDLFDSKLSEVEKEKMLNDMLQKIHKEYNMFTVTDVVWNHTSCDSEWLLEHPEAGYNLKNSPHLRSAFELDEALMEFSASFNANITSEVELEDALSAFDLEYFAQLRLYEFTTLNVRQMTEEFKVKWSKKPEMVEYPSSFGGYWSLTGNELTEFWESELVIDAKTFKRYSKRINIDAAVQLVDLVCKRRQINELDKQLSEFVKICDGINLKYYQQYDQDKITIFNQIRNRARFLRLDSHGPKLGSVSREIPLVDTYFTRLPKNDKTSKLDPDEMMLANNGWIWNADPLVNFASETSRAYFLREVIAWGDCVKLNYGSGPKDNPWLWKHQTEYTVKMAKLFHGFRIDNCHSTPIHVASYFLDQARRINPDLYVFAELFTGSEEKDIIFVSKLGIHSLIREAMNAWDTAELSRLCHRQGGSPAGSFTLPSNQFPIDILGHETGSGYHAIESQATFTVQVESSKPHALFMDCTHDNETPHQKRTAIDTLPNAALVAMSNCAIGSVNGYDQIVPKLLDVVSETRKYRLPSMQTGILPVKSLLYPLHAKMACQGYTEIHVHQEEDFISIHRIHPMTHDGYLLIARTAFRGQKSNHVHSPIKLRNQHVRVLQSATLYVDSNEPTTLKPYSHQPGDLETEEDRLPPPTSPNLFHAIYSSNPDLDETQYCDRNGGCINGLPSKLDYSVTESTITRVRTDGSLNGDFETIIESLGNFEPGSIVLYRTWVAGCGLDSKLDIVKHMDDLSLTVVPKDTYPGILEHLWLSLGLQDHNVGVEIMSRLGGDLFESGIPWSCTAQPRFLPGLHDAVKRLNMVEINVLLYRCNSEEKDTIGEGVYDIPGFGPLAYCGLQGFVSVALPVARNNDLGHPLCSNLRAGPWMCDYIIARLKKYVVYYPLLNPMLGWLQLRLDLVKKLPLFLRPKYFIIVIMSAYEAVRHQALFSIRHSKVTRQTNVSTLQSFAYGCAMTAFQMFGSVKSTGLLPGPYPLPLKSPEQQTPIVPVHGLPIASLAAGLPHFSVEYCRCWGRDIFIALRGLLLIPGHFEQARTLLISFGSTLRHGMIPNLLDMGSKPRYNARDATWFWIASVFDYCSMSTEGYDFLDAAVARRFIPLKRYTNPLFGHDKPGEEDPDADKYIPMDHQGVYMHTSTIGQLCHEILERHMQGISFREWNAGANLDHAMRNDGFDIQVGIDSNGFVFGGNRWNCGTWMDKMGDSAEAGNRGIPATPRDGSAVELVGLLKRCLRCVNELIQRGDPRWPWEIVSFEKGTPF
jgi:glycogen debranching enzyme